MPMYDPPHPGEIVREDCLEYLNLTIEEAADGLGATLEEVYGLVSCQIGVSTEMAIRLSKAFGSTPETWLGMQIAYDLWQAREFAESLEVTRLAPPAA